MKTRHITLPIDPQRLINDDRLRNSFIELFGSENFTRAVDPDTPDGTYDYTAEEVKNMSQEEYEEKREDILISMAKGRIQK